MLRSRFRWRIATSLTVLAGSILLWWNWSLPSLERWYFWPYLNCALQGDEPGFYSEIHWLYKTATGRKPELATDQDVVSSPGKRGSSLPIRLSATARKGGWTNLASGEEEWIEIRRLQPFLRQDFYDGQSLSRMLLTPLLWSIGVLLCLLATEDLLRRRRSRIDRHWIMRVDPPQDRLTRCQHVIWSALSASMKIAKALTETSRRTPALNRPDIAAREAAGKSTPKATSLFGAGSRTPGERLVWKPTERDRLM